VLFIAEFFLSQAHYELLSVGSFRFELGILCGLLIAGLVQAFKGPSVHHVKIPIAGLPKAFDGFRIIQVSDLHIGLTIRTAYVRNVVKLVNESAADLIALTGDITDGSPVELGAIANQLSEMRSTYGRYFVTGNHEYYWNALGWIEYHRAAGTHVLINESRLITKDGATIAILGVPDVKGYQFVPSHVSDPQRAAAGVPSGTIKILLAHQPISYKKAQIAGVHLQLSGHTHSGQYFPFNLLIGFFQDYYRGLNRFKDMWIYVNPGTGYWGPPLRTAVASEITAITLTCA
jgi:predicted MPP superfamily phosphohydrolase